MANLLHIRNYKNFLKESTREPYTLKSVRTVRWRERIHKSLLSYDPTPSQEDIHVTRRLVEAGKIMGIEVLDHLVIGNHKFTSLKEKGYL